MPTPNVGHTSSPIYDDQGDEDPPSRKRRRKESGIQGLLAREVGLMRNASGQTSATFVGSASGIHFIRSVYGALGSPANGITSPGTNLVPGEDDQLVAAAKSIWYDHEIADIELLKPSFDQLVLWTDSYFDDWHPAFPFLHAPTVLESLENISHGRLSNVTHWQIVAIKSIMSISLADRRQSGQQLSPVPQSLVFQTFDDALDNAKNALKRPASIAGVQAVIGVQLFLVSMLRLNAAARLGGLIVQLMFQLGLHRCPMRYTNFSTEEVQLRKRVWWSFYIIERYTCQALGLPLTVHDADVDVCHMKEELHVRGQSRQEPDTESADTRMQLFGFLAIHAQLRGSIMEIRNKRVEERDHDPETAIYLNARLTAWWNEIEDFLDQPGQSISQLHETVLEMLKHESIIMLNRPLLSLPKGAANHASAIQACIGAAKSLLSTLSRLQDASKGAAPPMSWPSFTWAAWMSGFIFIHAATEGKVTIPVATRNVDKSLKVLESLAARGSVWPRACAVAIQDLRDSLLQRGNTKPVRGRESTVTPSVNGQFDAVVHPNADIQSASIDTAQHLTRRVDTRTGTLFQSSSKSWQNSSGPVSTQTVLPRSDIPHSAPPVNDRWHRTALQAENDGDAMYFEQNQLPSNWLPMSSYDFDPLQGFEIPFWIGADNTLAWMNNTQ